MTRAECEAYCTFPQYCTFSPMFTWPFILSWRFPLIQNRWTEEQYLHDTAQRQRITLRSSYNDELYVEGCPLLCWMYTGRDTQSFLMNHWKRVQCRWTCPDLPDHCWTDTNQECKLEQVMEKTQAASICMCVDAPSWGICFSKKAATGNDMRTQCRPQTIYNVGSCFHLVFHAP